MLGEGNGYLLFAERGVLGHRHHTNGADSRSSRSSLRGHSDILADAERPQVDEQPLG
jgi:hypothetical protein